MISYPREGTYLGRGVPILGYLLPHPDLAGRYLPWLGGDLPWGTPLPCSDLAGEVPTLDRAGTYLGVPPYPC